MAQNEPRKAQQYWSDDHIILFLRQVLDIHPYTFKKRTKESGEAWQAIADKLNNVETPTFKVTKKSLSEKFRTLMEEYNAKEKRNDKASGIEVDDPTELEKLYFEISNEMIIANETLLQHSEEAKSKEEKEKETALEVRKVAMETMGESRKRSLDSGASGSSDSNSTTPPGPGVLKRRMGSETLVYLRDSADAKREDLKLEREIRKQELEFRNKEHEERTKQTNMVMAQVQQQTTLQNQFMQQQMQQQQQQFQLQTELMKSLINKLNPN